MAQGHGRCWPRPLLSFFVIRWGGGVWRATMGMRGLLSKLAPPTCGALRRRQAGPRLMRGRSKADTLNACTSLAPRFVSRVGLDSRLRVVRGAWRAAGGPTGREGGRSSAGARRRRAGPALLPRPWVPPPDRLLFATAGGPAMHLCASRRAYFSSHHVTQHEAPPNRHTRRELPCTCASYGSLHPWPRLVRARALAGILDGALGRRRRARPRHPTNASFPKP